MPEVAFGPYVLAQPLWLLALLALPFVVLLRRRQRRTAFRLSTTASAERGTQTLAARLRGLPFLLRLLACALVIVALARPQQRNARIERSAEGLDILLVLDTSDSMRAMDFQPNRFESARTVAAEFVRGRISDRIGLVVFAAEAYTQAPLTLDYPFLLAMLREVQVGTLGDGTAIGTALATAVNRLKGSRAVSKVVILLTDGQNNRGEIDPLTAAEVAQALGVRVYAIGVGTRGMAPFPSGGFLGPQMVPVEIDEETLGRVAERTGGRYFRATDEQALRSIYAEIGALEKTRVDERLYTDVAELFPWFLWPALLLLLLERLLAATRLRTFP